MSSNWISNLDMLAQNGVIGFDAPAYVMDQKPRYIGNPQLELPPFEGPIPDAPLMATPTKDEFNSAQKEVNKQKEINKDDNMVHNPKWKKILLGAIGVGALVVGGVKFKSTILPWIKNGCGIKSLGKGARGGIKGVWNNAVNVVKKAGKAVGDFFKSCWNKFTGLFKSKKKA